MKVASNAQSHRELGTEFWAKADLVHAYAGGDLRPVEVTLLERHRDALSGRVLELGVGGGRVTRHLCAIATDVHGIDVSAAMVEHSRAAFPDATIVQRDLRDLSLYDDESFDALVAAFNVLDILDHDDRRLALAGFARVLAPGGLLIMSSHNRAHAPLVVGPTRRLLGNVRAGRLRSAAGDLVRLPRSIANRRRLEPHERALPTLRDRQRLRAQLFDPPLLHLPGRPGTPAVGARLHARGVPRPGRCRRRAGRPRGRAPPSSTTWRAAADGEA